ncbi:MAG: DEAD/DEAH box helicase [Gemmatimonadaceae bacterium]|nr:DEAD/DEAH box helicase [Gemmatimonadaceae bacterium]
MGRAKTSSSALKGFHPEVRDWFLDRIGNPSEPQQGGWRSIASGSHTLILAPTGTGKTFAAFLWELNDLIVRGLKEPLPNATQLVYISPLKALNNDIQRNLDLPLAELRSRFENAGKEFPEIRIGVRTGDTPASARARMLRKAPHILITTPESLSIMLTTIRGRGIFTGTRAVIIDEIHAIAGTKRGSHLALTIERLEEVCEAAPQRIGLSATQRPLEEVARFLGGTTTPIDGPQTFRPVTIVDCGMTKEMHLSIESPLPDLGKVGGSVWPAVAQLVLNKIREHRTTLVFVNNRAQAEKIAGRVNALAEEEIAQPYHGSLSRERRHGLEERLKAGALRALVTTSSLELGIDIGTVDLVIQLQSPKRVASGLQRVGRAGHTLGVASRGIFVPTFRDDAMEIAAIIPAMRAGEVEPTVVIQNALDVLAQAIVSAVAVDDWVSTDLFKLVRRAYPYHRLTRNAFDEVLAMVSGKYPSDIASELEPRITWDRVADRLTGSRAARITAVVSGGTIPDRGLYTVNLPDRTRLGELDEEFVHETRVGDVFQLGSTTWRVASIEHDRVVVNPAPGVPARMPFWHGEYFARSLSLSRRVGALRRELAGKTSDKALAEKHACDPATIHSLREYVAQQRASTEVVPDDQTIVVETFRDETGAVRIVIHAAYGGRINAPWGMALAQRIRDTVGTEPQVQTTDDGIMLRLPDLGMTAPISEVMDLSATEAERLVLEEVGGTSLFGARFRMNAARALLLPRGNPKRRMPLWLQRLKSLDLLQAVRQFPSFPMLVETYREVLQDAFDMEGLKQVLTSIERGEVKIHTVTTSQPSPFAASLQFGFVMDWMYGDDTPRAEQRAAILTLDRSLLGEVMGEEASDDTTQLAIAQVTAERSGIAERRRARAADELAVLIDRAGDLSFHEIQPRIASEMEGRRGDPLNELLAAGRVIGIRPGVEEWRLILTETFSRYLAALGEDQLSVIQSGIAREERASGEAVPEILRNAVLNRPTARREILSRYLATHGPTTIEEIKARYGWDGRWIETRLSEWQRTGKLVQGRFRADVTEPEWCSRRIVEIARRRALSLLRKQIEAVDLPVFASFLQRWQHVDPRERLSGAHGVSASLKQLYGIARPATKWERDYLRSRVEGYDPNWLSQVNMNEETVWVGDSPREKSDQAPTLSRLRFIERGAGSLWLEEPDAARPSEDAALVLKAIQQEGASFISDLQIASGLGMFAIREALRGLAALGLVTNDSVEAMRQIVRWKPMTPRNETEATRWLPEGFKPSADRKIIQRRPNLRRLPKWKRPDAPGGTTGWVGRWSLVWKAGIIGPQRSIDDRAEMIARQWLRRYGIVTRDWWRRERPPVSWRDIYHQLKRLEFRGEVRRGYFVKGLGGAQFALPDAVERLRAIARDDASTVPLVLIGASDPANVYNLTLETVDRDPLSRPRGPGGLLVTRAGRVLASVEGRGKRITLASDVTQQEWLAIRELLAAHLRGERGARDLLLSDIRPA